MKHTLYIYTAAIVLLIMAACDNDTHPDNTGQMLPLTVVMDVNSSLRGTSPLQGEKREESLTLTINGQTRHYTLTANGNILTPDPGQEPVYITRGAATASVQTHGTLLMPENVYMPYRVDEPAININWGDTSKPTLTITLAPASAQVSIAVTNGFAGGAHMPGVTAEAIALNTPAFDAVAGKYHFDSTPALLGNDPAAPPVLTTHNGTVLTYSAPVQCMPTTVPNGRMLFVLTTPASATATEATYPVYADSDYTFEAGKNYRFIVQIDNKGEFTIQSISIKAFTAGDNLNIDAPNPAGYDMIIANKVNLEEFRDRVNAGEYSLSAIQVADIDLGGEEWVPIGYYDDTAGNYSIFRGIYNGSGYTISNMKIKGTYFAAGLFGYAGTGAILTGIRLEGVQIDCTADYAGALVGLSSGSSASPVVISHCNVQGTITADAIYTGGLAGYVQNTHITHCHAQCVVKVTTTDKVPSAGGLVGSIYSGSIIVACSTTGNGTIEAKANGEYNIPSAGGLVGINNGSNIYFCRATQLATATHSNDGVAVAGGLVGYNIGTITACYATGGATASTTGIKLQGTFIGYNYENGTITHCHAVPGTGDAKVTIGRDEGNAFIQTDPAKRYDTVAASDAPSITALTVMRDPTTGLALLPPVEYTFTVTNTWTNEEFPTHTNIMD